MISFDMSWDLKTDRNLNVDDNLNTHSCAYDVDQFVQP